MLVYPRANVLIPGVGVIYQPCWMSYEVVTRFCLSGMSERERQVMKKLKEVVDKQRDEIRAKDRELTLKNEDVEAVSDINTSQMSEL